MKVFNHLLILSVLILASCSLLTLNRSFVDEMDHETDGFWVPGEDFPLAAGDSGRAYRTRDEIMQRTPSSLKEKVRYMQGKSIDSELSYLEGKLTYKEYQNYQENADLLPTTSEKIYYLRLKTPAERADYLYSRGLYRQNGMMSSQREISAAIDSGQVALGMSKDDVVRAWGRPARVDVAGNPKNQNERWTFYYHGELKQVFFEGGRVQGWDIK